MQPVLTRDSVVSVTADVKVRVYFTFSSGVFGLSRHCLSLSDYAR